MGLGQAYRFIIFDRKYSCRLDYKWPSKDATRTASKESTSPTSVASEEPLNANLSDTETMQLIMGMTFSLKNMMLRLAPETKSGTESGSVSAGSSRRSSQVSSPVVASSGQVMRRDICFSYLTSKYRLSYFESLSGWKLVLLSEPVTLGTADIEQAMRRLYHEVLVRQVIHSPLFRLTEASFNRPNVINQLESCIRSL